jgi:hypothetical protein
MPEALAQPSSSTGVGKLTLPHKVPNCFSWTSFAWKKRMKVPLRSLLKSSQITWGRLPKGRRRNCLSKLYQPYCRSAAEESKIPPFLHGPPNGSMQKNSQCLCSRHEIGKSTALSLAGQEGFMRRTNTKLVNIIITAAPFYATRNHQKRKKKEAETLPH